MRTHHLTSRALIKLLLTFVIISYPALPFANVFQIPKAHAETAKIATPFAPINLEDEEIWFGEMVSDGQGGALIAYVEFDAPEYDTPSAYIQRFDSNGDPLWSEGGVLLSLPSIESISTSSFNLIADGSGGAFIAFTALVSGESEDEYSIYVQKLDSTGDTLWTEGGELIQIEQFSRAELTPGDDGGVLATWITEDEDDIWEIRAQYFNSTGVAQWGENGVVVQRHRDDDPFPGFYKAVHNEDDGFLIGISNFLDGFSVQQAAVQFLGEDGITTLGSMDFDWQWQSGSPNAGNWTTSTVSLQGSDPGGGLPPVPPVHEPDANTGFGTADDGNTMTSSFPMDISSSWQDTIMVTTLYYVHSTAEVSSVTFNSDTFTQICRHQEGNLVTEMWYLVAPDDTEEDVIVTFDETFTSRGMTNNVYSGVDQGSPIFDFNCDGDDSDTSFFASVGANNGTRSYSLAFAQDSTTESNLNSFDLTNTGHQDFLTGSGFELGAYKAAAASRVGVNPDPVSAADGDFWIESIVPDGEGGMIMHMGDNDLMHVFLQRFDEDGAQLWGEGGMDLTPVSDEAWPEAMIPDGEGDFIVMYADGILSDSDWFDLYFVKLDIDGAGVWMDPLVLDAEDIDKYIPSHKPLSTDGDGGLIVFYAAYDLNTNLESTRIQRITDEGEFVYSGAGGPILGDEDNIMFMDAVAVSGTTALVAGESGGEILLGITGPAYQVLNLDEDLDVLNLDGISYAEGESGGLGVETVQLWNTDAELALAEFDFEFVDADSDWDSISAGVDESSGKSFVHGLTDLSDGPEEFALFVPLKPGQNAVRICPGADSLEAVNMVCADGEILTSQDEDVEIVQIDGKNYWKVSGLTGTGGVGVNYASGASFNINPNFASTSDTVEVSVTFIADAEYSQDDVIAIDFNTGGDFVLGNCSSATTDADGDSTPDGAGIADTNGGPNADRFLYTFTDSTTTASTGGIELCIEVSTPSDAGNYQVDLSDSLGAYGSAIFYVGNENQVLITAEVDTILTMVLRNADDTADLANVGGGSVGPNLCDLGSLNENGVQECSYRIKVATNSLNGYDVYIETDGSLRNFNDTLFIANIPNDTQVTAGTEGYGLALNAGMITGGSVYEEGDFGVDDTPLATGVTDGINELLYWTTGSNNPGETDLVNTALITHRAEMGGSTASGTYTQLVTYTVTASF